MKTTLRQLIDPANYYCSTIAEYALIVQELMKTATAWRSGNCGGGPYGDLNGYHGCTGGGEQCWHSNRNHSVTAQQHRETLRNALLRALCNPAGEKWRRSISLDLDKEFKLRVKGDGGSRSEESAFNDFMVLNKTRVDHPHSFNSCHRVVNVIWEPQLQISIYGINVTARFTTMSEIRTSGTCASAWDMSFLLGEWNKPWSPYRETFTEFIRRSIDFIKGLKAAEHSRKI